LKWVERIEAIKAIIYTDKHHGFDML